MHLLLVGISHRTAPVELRERVDFQARGLDRAVQELARSRATREAVVLSTCNRAEVYAACDDLTRSRADVVTFMSAYHGVQHTDIRDRTGEQKNERKQLGGRNPAQRGFGAPVGRYRYR